MRRPIGIGVLALALVACGTAASPSPSPAPTASALPAPTDSGPALTPVPGTSDVAAPTAPSQTDTEWGLIWDAVPPGFPILPGSTPAEADQPVSAEFDTTLGIAEAASLMQERLELARFSTVTMSGPGEDGSIVIESVGPESTACRVQTALTPLGDLTGISVWYGAACPFE
jgi:hypothetical protein